MKPNADLTIYSKGVDPTTRTETWTRSVVTGVTWEDRKAENVLRSGNLQADRVAVYIPLTRLASIKVEDVIVRGVVTDTIGLSFTISALKAKYPNCATVRSVDRMDRGSITLRHLQVGAT